MKLLLQILFFVIIQSFAYSQESKADYYFGVDLRWATVCEYDINLEKCTSDNVGAFHMNIEKYPDKIGLLTLGYKGSIKFNILDISFSDPDNYVLKLSDKRSKLYTAILSLDYIPNSRARMYTKLIISDGVEALVFETDIGAIEYMTQIEDKIERESHVKEEQINSISNRDLQRPIIHTIKENSHYANHPEGSSSRDQSTNNFKSHHSEDIFETLFGRLFVIFVIAAILLRLFR